MLSGSSSISSGRTITLGILKFAEFLQFRVGEGRLRRTAPTEHVNIAHVAVLERFERVIGDVGLRQFVVAAGEDARHVHRHVAVADDGDPFLRQVEAQVAVIGMPVVPADELGRRVAAGQVFAGDTHFAVALRADGVNDRVIMGDQVVVA